MVEARNLRRIWNQSKDWGGEKNCLLEYSDLIPKSESELKSPSLCQRPATSSFSLSSPSLPLCGHLLLGQAVTPSLNDPLDSCSSLSDLMIHLGMEVILHSQVKASLTIYDAWMDLQDGFAHTAQGDGRPASAFFPLVVSPTSKAGILFSICLRVYADGSICLDILQNQWSPIYDVATILTSIQSLLCDPNPNSPANSKAARMFGEMFSQSLLCDPNPNSPANSEAGRMFSENKREYNRRVREIVEQSWTAD